MVEASGVTEWIYDRLTDLGMEVFPAHPANIRRVLGKKRAISAVSRPLSKVSYYLLEEPRPFAPNDQGRASSPACATGPTRAA